MAAPTSGNNYELYRSSTIGETLIDTIDELINDGRIEPQLAMSILDHFDRTIADVLSSSVKARLTFKGHLETYRFCDDVWTFLVKDVKFKVDQMGTGRGGGGSEEWGSAKCKIVACNSGMGGRP